MIMFDNGHPKVNQSYIAPFTITSPLTLFDAYEMGDLVRWAMTWTDAAVVADIATHMAATNMSGQDFLGLNDTELQTLSRNDSKAFRELRHLQRIAPKAIPSLLTPLRRSGLQSIYPELIIGSARENFGSDSSATLSPQILDAFDYGDDEDEPPHSTVAVVSETSSLPLPLPSQAADFGVAQPDALASPAPENGPPLSSSKLSDVGEDVSGEDNSKHFEQSEVDASQNNLAISTISTFLPNSQTSTAVNEPSSLPLPLPSQAANFGAAQPDASVNPAPENGLPLASSNSSDVGDDVLGEDNSNHLEQSEVDDSEKDLVISTSIITFTSTAVPTKDVEEVHNTELQPTRDEPVSPIMTCTDQVSDFVFPSPDLSAHSHSMPSTRSSSPALSYVDDEDSDTATQLSEILHDINVPNPHTQADSNIVPQQEFTLATEPLSQSTPDSLEGSQLRDLFIFSFDRSGALITVDVDLEPLSASLSSLGVPLLNLHVPDLELYNLVNDNTHEAVDDQTPQSSNNAHTRHSPDADIQNVATSTDETPEDSVVEVSSDLSQSCPGTPERLEEFHDLDTDTVSQHVLDTQESNEDVNTPDTPTHGSTFTLPPDVLPVIPVTPPDSPIFEGLSQYMTSDGSEASGIVVQDSSIVDQDNVVTPGERTTSASERTLWPSLETPRAGLLSSRSANGQSLSESSDESRSTSGSGIDIPIQPDVPASRVQVPSRESSQIHRILRAIPTIFAVDRETINRAASCSAAGSRL